MVMDILYNIFLKHISHTHTILLYFTNKWKIHNGKSQYSYVYKSRKNRNLI